MGQISYDCCPDFMLFVIILQRTLQIFTQNLGSGRANRYSKYVFYAYLEYRFALNQKVRRW
jgi:hypothetical protein